MLACTSIFPHSDDYVSVDKTLTLVPEDPVPRACTNITILNDDIFEDAETFRVSLSSEDPRVNIAPDGDTTIVTIFDPQGE